MLHCQAKSILMTILESLPDTTGANEHPNSPVDIEPETASRVVLIDGMAEVQAMDKPEWVKSCCQLAQHFTTRILDKHREVNEIRVIFDRYDVEHSLK
jgi:hypothetical protein